LSSIETPNSHVCESVSIESGFVFIEYGTSDKIYAFHIVTAGESDSVAIALEFDRKSERDIYIDYVCDAFYPKLIEKLKAVDGCPQCSDVWEDKFEVWAIDVHNSIQDHTIKVIPFDSIPEMVLMELSIRVDGPEDDPKLVN
jgi:hypothetical protein